MRYRRFEELPVWNDAINLAVRVFAVSETGRLSRFSGLRDQIERAVVSISNNIAEGFERGTTAELLTFLYIARGSAGEVRSMLCLLERISAFDDLKSVISELKSRATSVSRQLGAWIESLKNSEIKGTRYLDDRKRQETDALRRRDAFLEELRRVIDEKRPPKAGDDTAPI
jgi:four helix bundle protein